MLFNSAAFAVFFVIVFGLYWLLRRHYHAQNVLLVAASYFFYGWWDVRFLVLLVISTVVDYFCAWSIQKGRMPLAQRARASAFLVLASLVSLGVNFRAFDPGLVGHRPVLAVDWDHVLTAAPMYWWMISAVTLAVILFNIAYPALTRLSSDHRRRFFLVLSVVVNLSILGFFKYFNFFADTFSVFVESLFGVAAHGWILNIILPVGISFYIFQTMSYTIDAYRGAVDVSRSVVEVAAYVSFFPQLVAGPIERGSHLLPQFRRPRTVSRADFRCGLWLITWGLYQKMVVADNMARIVDATFAPYAAGGLTGPIPHDGIRLLAAVYAFALQIYCDFAGYTDIARGTARLLGFEVMLNFNLPYIATDPSDFWRRWHISLSTWLRDYLYIPLGGNRHGTFQTYRNLMLTMLLGGLWHGAAWTFVLWGAFHGFILVVFRALSRARDKWASALAAAYSQGRFFRGSALVEPSSGRTPRSAGKAAERENQAISLRSGATVVRILVMFHLVCLGWLIFRAQNLATVGIFLQSIVLHPHWSKEAGEVLWHVVVYGWFFVLFELVRAWKGNLMPLENWPWFARLNVWIFVFMSLLALAARGGHEFIYFAF